MKATGIVRRIDDLGRVVIPKEIRRTMRIREGDPLEIFTNNNGEVIFKKYSPIGELNESAESLCESLSTATNKTIIIIDRDHCIAANGVYKKDIIDKSITKEIEQMLENRMNFTDKSDENIKVIENSELSCGVFVPIISGGDLYGAVVILKDENSRITELDEKICIIGAKFLSKQLEH